MRFTAVISLDNMNVIYTTVKNSITITANAPMSDIEVTIDKGGIISKGHFSNSYGIVVNNEGDYLMTISQISSGAKVSYTLRAKKLPVPVAHINNTYGDSISLEKLHTAKELGLSYIPTFDFYIIADVSSYTVLKISKNNSRSEFNNISATFSNEAKAILNSCLSGDIIIFKNIIAKGPDPGLLKVPDLVLYVK